MHNNARHYTHSFGFQWLQHAKTQLDSVVGKPITENRLFGVTLWPKNLEGQRVLEAGSGAGRFTQVLLTTGAHVYSFDPSEAVEANCANNGHHANLHLFRADIFHIPNNIGLFDKVICLGVLQHTPDPRRGFMELVKFLKPDGEIVIDIYKKTFPALLQWKYVLRPITRQLPGPLLYRLVRLAVSVLLPLTLAAHKVLGSIGARLFPIASYPALGLSYPTHKEWAILDTFDMYSPQYDKPQTLRTVQRWFKEAGLKDVNVHYGPNGIVGRARR